MRHLDAVRRFCPRARTLLLTADLHYLREEREAALRDDDGLRRRAARTRRDELSVIDSVDFTIVHSAHERDLLLKQRPDVPVVAYAWSTEAPALSSRSRPASTSPSSAATSTRRTSTRVLYFAREVFPLIEARLPGVKFYAVGSNPPAELASLGAGPVVVTGYVPI